jgi:tRNA modification GTPase
MAANDIIAAIATAPGRGGIGIVRVSGLPLRAFAEQLLGAAPPPRRATFARFLDAQGASIDEGIALYFLAPHSYTGEDVLELQGHGGSVVLQQLLERCLQLGARIAQPGEFTQRAFLQGKLDLAQAEAVADLINATTSAAARSAVRSLQGEFSDKIQALVRGLVDLRARVEAAFDFPEEDIEVLQNADTMDRLRALERELASAWYWRDNPMPVNPAC